MTAPSRLWPGDPPSGSAGPASVGRAPSLRRHRLPLMARFLILDGVQIPNLASAVLAAPRPHPRIGAPRLSLRPSLADPRSSGSGRRTPRRRGASRPCRGRCAAPGTRWGALPAARSCIARSSPPIRAPRPRRRWRPRPSTAPSARMAVISRPAGSWWRGPCGTGTCSGAASRLPPPPRGPPRRRRGWGGRGHPRSRGAGSSARRSGRRKVRAVSLAPGLCAARGNGRGRRCLPWRGRASAGAARARGEAVGELGSDSPFSRLVARPGAWIGWRREG